MAGGEKRLYRDKIMKNKVGMALKIARAKLLNIRSPIIASWAITYRCNQQCPYCAYPAVCSNEVSTGEAKLLVDTLFSLGLQRLNFTGGEPLLRDDIGELVGYSKSKGIFTCINSNGSLVPRYKDKIQDVDLLNLSLEGDEDVHDRIRGHGSYVKVIDAVKTARTAGLKLRITTTLNKFNVEDLKSILLIGQNYGLKIIFQMLDVNKLGSRQSNPLVPSKEQLECALAALIAYKGSSPFKDIIGNSLSGLKYLLRRNTMSFLKCASGKVTFRVTPEGKMFPCAASVYRNNPDKNYSIDLLAMSAQQIMDTLNSFQYHDFQCFCACTNSIEANLLWNCDFRSLLEISNF